MRSPDLTEAHKFILGLILTTLKEICAQNSKHINLLFLWVQWSGPNHWTVLVVSSRLEWLLLWLWTGWVWCLWWAHSHGGWEWPSLGPLFLGNKSSIHLWPASPKHSYGSQGIPGASGEDDLSAEVLLKFCFHVFSCTHYLKQVTRSRSNSRRWKNRLHTWLELFIQSHCKESEGGCV